MDEIDARLRETADNCIKAYDAWSKSKKNAEARSSLLEAVHELRKVSARLEIELASSERDETQRQIPIPTHRSSRPRGGQSGADLPDFITDNGNANDDDSIGNSVEGSESSSQSSSPNRPQQRGGGQNRMQHRRPMRPRQQQDNGE